MYIITVIHPQKIEILSVVLRELKRNGAKPSPLSILKTALFNPIIFAE